MRRLVSSFLEEQRSHGASGNTLDAYRRDLLMFIAWFEGTVGELPEAGAVTQIDVAEFRSWLSRTQKPATVNRRLNALRSFYKWALSNGHAKEDPVRAVREVPQQRPGPRSLDRREVGALLREAKRTGTQRDVAFITLLAQTGLRVSEAVLLRWEDITLNERSGSVVVRNGKGNKWREVPLNLTARKSLEAIRPEPLDPGRRVFRGRRGNFTRSGALQMIGRLAKRAGVDATPHTLRHTFCKNLVDAGVPLDQVTELAGHASVVVTTTYTRPNESDLTEAVKKTDWV